MGEYDKALIIYDVMLDKATRENNLELVQAIHYQLGEFFAIHTKDWNRAKEHMKKMFSIQMYDGSAVCDEAQNDMVEIFSTMRNILMHEELDENEFQSFVAELLNKLITLYLDYPAQTLSPLDYQLAADHYNYIGWARKNQGKLSEAWTHHQQALEIINKHLPPTHPRLALTYYHIGLLHSATNDHLNALDYLEKALEIQENVLQPQHPHLAETHYQLSVIFEQLNKIDDAFQHAKKAIDIARHAFSTSHDPEMIQYQEQYNKILL
jgi:tetratricopeptide (TPR) repeat protein